MSTLATDDLTELVQGMGQASPGPLFLIDESGVSHPLNGLAERLGVSTNCGQCLFVANECLQSALDGMPAANTVTATFTLAAAV